MRILAPGKVVLIGEYAVLDGGPAIVAAVDRGVCCEVSPGDAVETPGDDRFVTAGLRAVSAPPRHYRFYDQVSHGLEGKPGFGGSAAAVVAACAAGLWARKASWGALERLALQAHFQVQGSGSGLDVRAAVHGGVLRVEGEGTESLKPLPIVAIWSGTSASTGPRVERYLAWVDRALFVDRSRALVDAFPQDPVAALAEAESLLASMATSAGFSYRTPAHLRIASLAQEFGGAAKPSGAGGGDISVALIPDPESREAFCIACERELLTPIRVKIAPGVAGSSHV